MLRSVLLTSFLLSAPAFAEVQVAPVPDAATPPDYDGGAIIVTATRAPIAIDRLASSVTVLDKAAIDRAQDIGVTELLWRTPGVTVSRNGGYGTVTSVRIRGAEAEQTVVVIDGVKLNDPSSTSGGYNFANLLVGDAQRIEVLRGPQSILWGSQAIGGVVNVVTAMPEKDLEASFDVEAGSRDTVNARAGLGGRTGPLAWRIGGNVFTTDGISAIRADQGGGERDGYSNRSLTGRAELEIADGVSADVRGYYSRGRTEIDGFAGDTAEYGINREFVGYAGLNVALLDGRFRNRFAFGYTDTDRDNYDPTRQRQQTFDAAGRNRRFEYQGSFAITDTWTALFGVENERSRFRTVSPAASLAIPVPDPVRGHAGITSLYAQLTGEVLPGLTVNGGVRHDDHKTYGGKTQFAGGGAWSLPTGTVLRASYAEGFKAPTLYQLYSEYGNTTLSPERARGWEAGIEQHLFSDALTLGATWFDRRTKDQIDFYSCPFPAPTDPDEIDPLCLTPAGDARFGYYLNIARTRSRGIEATASLKLSDRLLVDGNYSWIDAENRDTGKWLSRRPRNAANGSISYQWPFGLTTGAAVRWAGKSYDDAGNNRRLDDYTLVDLRAEYDLGGGVRLFGRIENLFDEDYQTVYRYGTLGRSVYGGVRARF
ncbi:TonB-dependent receptor plug domain-containing protein [Edaphosphingomonas haloaromaticamans]|uniref:Vitamin B12 transporter BtuB n=1 Tax=Edaphosphingomonas haloaromaticamans TaxID=653954 RepID=A0A1S1HI46_9SPHN|nr:TonB-dependent receptor [Sphingomonas haloaromaticamans]OHT21915.1 Vitamin B12 transporter BtuB precursor [Sphingomonas haloaromaticamans]